MDIEQPNFEATIMIEVVKGGFMLHYPENSKSGSIVFSRREIFTSQRKLNQKLKEVLEDFSTVPADTGKAD